MRKRCARRDLNPHELPRRNLNPVRLPIPPLAPVRGVLPSASSPLAEGILSMGR
jgi:hypothetical protein